MVVCGETHSAVSFAVWADRAKSIARPFLEGVSPSTQQAIAMPSFQEVGIIDLQIRRAGVPHHA